MIGVLLIIQVPNARHKWAMSLFLRPVDSLLLSPKCPEYLVGVIFYYIVINACAFRTTFRASFYVDVGHRTLLWV